jgi:peptidoglycan hydrolase CwlO-like protein
MNKRWVWVLVALLLWLAIVYFYGREHFTSIPPPTTASLAAEVSSLTTRLDENEEQLQKLQATADDAQKQIAQGKAQVAAAQAGLQLTMNS